MIKIYPCLVLKGTKAYEWYNRGAYTPYTNEEATNLIAEIKKNTPSWIRIMRVQRDIPAPLIVAGVKRSNLRQPILEKLKTQGFRCRCIRCREIGHRMAIDGVKPNPRNIEIVTTKYAASEGEEIFVSAEDSKNDVLVGYLRMRVPSGRAHRLEITTESCSIVRELHVYGPLVPVGKHATKAWQHKGYGQALLAEAERISRDDYSFKKILVISALGTRKYYERFGYKQDSVYVSKRLEN
jgi:elongator complex protein 3